MGPNETFNQTTSVESPEEEIKSRSDTRLSVGDKVVASFDSEYNPRRFEQGYVSKMGGRKHIIPDRNRVEPEPGINYVVKVARDTNPTTMRGGAYIGEILRPTKYGQIQLDARIGGWEKAATRAKVNYDSELITKEHVLERYINTYGIDPNASEFYVSEYDEGDADDFDESRYTVWQREKRSIPIGCEHIYPPEVVPHKQNSTQLPNIAPNSHVETEQQEQIRNYIPPFEIMKNGNLRMLDIEVECIKEPGQRVPSAEKFKYFTHDEKTLDLLYRVASAYQRRSPFFVEGGTATSKTSVAEYFAHIINSDLYRINLSGQTDTSELIGKYVPNDGSAMIEFDKLVKGWCAIDEQVRNETLEKLTPESQEVLKRAYDDKQRPLTKEECQQIARNEGLNIPDTMWVWKDGFIPHAMKHGGIVLLDEATLGMTEVLERLNSVLEDPPTLMVSEGGGYTIGPKGDYQTHKNFWIMGTGNVNMNGRIMFTPAFQRRLPDYYSAPDPTRDEYEAMLRYMVYGTQPKVTIKGIEYHDPTVRETDYSKLAAIPNISSFLTDLADFHTDMIRMTDYEKPTIGIDRRKGGKYTITRQNLLSTLQYLSLERTLNVQETARMGMPVYNNDWPSKAKEALIRFYSDPVQEGDRKNVTDAIDKYDLLSPSRVSRVGRMGRAV